MADVDFTARNTGGGSATIFENPRLEGNSKIIFHRPHPSHQIDSVMLHAWGGRMRRRFGWRRERFILQS